MKAPQCRTGSPNLWPSWIDLQRNPSLEVSPFWKLLEKLAIHQGFSQWILIIPYIHTTKRRMATVQLWVFWYSTEHHRGHSNVYAGISYAQRAVAVGIHSNQAIEIIVMIIIYSAACDYSLLPRIRNHPWPLLTIWMLVIVPYSEPSLTSISHRFFLNYFLRFEPSLTNLHSPSLTTNFTIINHQHHWKMG